MVLNYIWVAFFVIAFIVALIKLLFMGNTEIFTELVNSTFTSSKTAFEISLGLWGFRGKDGRTPDSASGIMR